MFGLEKNKSKLNFLVFDLEKDLQTGKKQKQMVKDAQLKINNLKKVLRSGTESDDFEKYGLLLHGYTALLKILTSVNSK